jgi:hypothetical protein
MSEETTPKRIFLVSVFRRITKDGAELVAVIPIDAHRLGLNRNELEFLENTPMHRMESTQMTNIMALGTVSTDFQNNQQVWVPDRPFPDNMDAKNDIVVLTAVHPITIKGPIVKLYEASLLSKTDISAKGPSEVLEDLLFLQKQIENWRNPLLSFFSQLSIRIGDLRIPQLGPKEQCELDFCPNPA